jgi:transcriptional regulator with XRE-family HTH domain
MHIKHGLQALSNRLDELSKRIHRIRLPQKLIAEHSGLDETTISRTLLGKTDPLNSTLDKIEAVITAEEQKLQAALDKGAAA